MPTDASEEAAPASKEKLFLKLEVKLYRGAVWCLLKKLSGR